MLSISLAGWGLTASISDNIIDLLAYSQVHRPPCVYPRALPRTTHFPTGLGVSDTGNLRNASVDANRIDLLRCIVSCSADTLYQADPLRPNKFIKAMTGELHMFNVTFCYSLLNTVFSYDPQVSFGALLERTLFASSQGRVLVSYKLPCASPMGPPTSPPVSTW